MKDIINGIWNDWYPNESITTEAKRRLAICLTPDGLEPHCRYYNPKGIVGAKCNGCGCYLKYKTKSKDSKCPMSKWEV